MSGYDLILWDFDGTLADSSADVWQSIGYAAKRCGAVVPEEYRNDPRNLSAPMTDIFAHLRPFPGAERFSAFDADVTRHYRSLNAFDSTVMYPGMEGLLTRLRRGGVRSAIVTNKPLEALERILATKGWADLFDGWIAVDSDPSLPGGMPKQEMMRRMVDRFHTDLAHALAVGDSRHDIAAAQAEGIDSLAVTYGDGDTAELLGQTPKYVADDVTAIASIIERE